MLHSTRVVLVMLAVITNRRAKRKVRDHNQWFGRMSANTTAKSILETTADLELQCCIGVEERPFMAALRNTKDCCPLGPGPAGLKPGDLLNLLCGL